MVAYQVSDASRMRETSKDVKLQAILNYQLEAHLLDLVGHRGIGSLLAQCTATLSLSVL